MVLIGVIANNLQVHLQPNSVALESVDVVDVVVHLPDELDNLLLIVLL